MSRVKKPPFPKGGGLLGATARLIATESPLKEVKEFQAREQQKREAGRARGRQIGGTHYKEMDVQPWDVVDTWPRNQQIGYYRGGALKYIMRMGSKDVSLTEIEKGMHYFEKLIETLRREK